MSEITSIRIDHELSRLQLRGAIDQELSWGLDTRVQIQVMVGPIDQIWVERVPRLNAPSLRWLRGLPRRPLGADFNAIRAHRPGTRNRWHLTSRMTMTKANAIAKSMAYHIEPANPDAC